MSHHYYSPIPVASYQPFPRSYIPQATPISYGTPKVTPCQPGPVLTPRSVVHDKSVGTSDRPASPPPPRRLNTVVCGSHVSISPPVSPSRTPLPVPAARTEPPTLVKSRVEAWESLSSPPRRDTPGRVKNFQEIQNFVEKSREFDHENRLPETRQFIDPPGEQRRSLSAEEVFGDNLADLRRRIADKYLRDRPTSPDRAVSGVFVSYPRKRRSLSAEEAPIQTRPEISTGGPRKKITEAEFRELRRNLLNKSEKFTF